MERIKEFYCDENLSQYTDSMLFDSVTNIASMTFEGEEYNIDLFLDIRGEVDVQFKGVSYKAPSVFPKELIDIIKNTPENWSYSNPDILYVVFNNWFECIFDIKDKDNNILYSDGIMYEDSVADKKPEDLKKYMFEICKRLYLDEIE